MAGAAATTLCCFLAMLMLLATTPAIAQEDECKPTGNRWCEARADVGEARLQVELDHACGHGANCSAIQPGAPCYNPNTRLAHASYAFNDFYQRRGRVPSACVFGGAGGIAHKPAGTCKRKPVHFNSPVCTKRSCKQDCAEKNPTMIIDRSYCTRKHGIRYCNCVVCYKS